jgi:hypothetical protein
VTGAAAKYAPWTAAESAALRDSYLSGGIGAARAALPSRSVNAIWHRAQILNLGRRRRWTAADDTRLRKLWDGELSVREIAAHLGRTPVTTYWRARQLGLPCGCPPGWEYLSHAAQRTGYPCTSQLRRVLGAAGATVRRALSSPRVDARAKHGTWIVRPAEVDLAVADWHETEPVETAARRLGIAGETLAKRLVKLGFEKPKSGLPVRNKRKRHWRVRPEEVALAMRAPIGRWAQRGTSP